MTSLAALATNQTATGRAVASVTSADSAAGFGLAVVVVVAVTLAMSLRRS